MKPALVAIAALLTAVCAFTVLASAESCIYTRVDFPQPCSSPAGACTTEACGGNFTENKCWPNGTYACIRDCGFGDCCCTVYSSDCLWTPEECRVGQGGKFRKPTLKIPQMLESDVLAFLPGGCSGYQIAEVPFSAGRILPARRASLRPTPRVQARL